MRFRKTPQAKRMDYIQLDEDNRKIIKITPDSDWGDYDTTFRNDKEKKEGHQAMIKKLHAIDDHETYM